MRQSWGRPIFDTKDKVILHGSLLFNGCWNEAPQVFIFQFNIVFRRLWPQEAFYL